MYVHYFNKNNMDKIYYKKMKKKKKKTRKSLVKIVS